MYKFYEQGEGKLQNEDPEGIKKEKDTYYALKQIFPQTLNDIVEPKYRDVESFKEISRDKFNSIIPITLKLEGGYSNNKYDRGGKTKYGITQIFIDEYKN
jgi:hypothetical protein